MRGWISTLEDLASVGDIAKWGEKRICILLLCKLTTKPLRQSWYSYTYISVPAIPSLPFPPFLTLCFLCFFFQILKVPKCEIFDLLYSCDFIYHKVSLRKRLWGWNKNFIVWAWYSLFCWRKTLLAYAQSTLTLSKKKKTVSDCFEVPLNVSK